jgi:integrase
MPGGLQTQRQECARGSDNSPRGAAAELPVDLRHPPALRHTCATEMLRAGADVGNVRIFLGHASVKTTSVYLASDEDRQEHVVGLRECGRPTLDEDRGDL